MTRAGEGPSTASASAPASLRVVSLYQFVRDWLTARGGTCTRDELLAAIQTNPAASERLERSRGFDALLSNMKHSGFIELDGDIVRRTARRVGHRHR